MVWLVSSVLVVRHSVLLFGARLEIICSTCAKWWSPHDSVFPEGRCLRQVWNFRVLPLRVTVGVVCVAQRGNRDSCEVHRIKLVEWIRVRCNNARIRTIHLSLPAQVILLSRRSLHEVGCGSVVLLCVSLHDWVLYCSSKGHQRHPLTKPHNPSLLRGGM